MSANVLDEPTTFFERSPTRIDLAGGTLDLWPLYAFIGEATTINFGIDIYSEAEFVWNKEASNSTVHFHIQGTKFQFQNLNAFFESRDALTSVVREVLWYHRKSESFGNRGFTVTSRSLSPVGGGLGGSSSLLITYLKLFEQVVPTSRMDGLARIQFAHNLEARILQTPTGTQDYFPPTFSGLNIIRYTDQSTSVDVLPLPTQMQDSFFLVYTGRPHHSGLNNFDVIQRVVNRDHHVLEMLKRIQKITGQLELAIRRGHFEEIPDLLNQENAARVDLSPGFSSPEIVQLQAIVASEADALKICGAGGGGCVLIWARPEKHAKLQTECQKAGFQILKPKATPPLSAS